MSKIYDYIIIGAGLSGIHLAHQLLKKNKSVLILEKSRNIGGRIANRRFHNYNFALGLKSFETKEKDLLHYALKGLKEGSLDYSCAHFFTKNDITKWTKNLLKSEFIKLSASVDKFIKRDNFYDIICSEGSYQASSVIISAPSEQASNILRKSSLTLSVLENVEYSKDIFYYCRTKESVVLKEFVKLEEEYKEGFYYTKFKANDWNELSRSDIKIKCDQELNPLESHAHKWRYSRVLKTLHPRYQISFKDKSVYLVGDYFFGNDLNAAIKSANYLLKYL